MGYGRWTENDWRSYSKENIQGRQNVEDIYTSRTLHRELDPKGIRFRESCDSEDNPNSTPVIVGLDVTGSMGFILDNMAREGLKELATEIYDRKPISDPHLMFMGIGDVKYDRAPLQVTQFEADIRVAEQLTNIYLEKGGGGNCSESYTLPWYFAAMHTRIDSYDKRGKKGFLFTIGDECIPEEITAQEIERVLGYRPQFDKISSKELFRLVSEKYEVFHIVIEEGSYCQREKNKVMRSWEEIIGQRAILLRNHRDLARVIVQILESVGSNSNFRKEEYPHVDKSNYAYRYYDTRSYTDLDRECDNRYRDVDRYSDRANKSVDKKKRKIGFMRFFD